jgi:hypothetical protein
LRRRWREFYTFLTKFPLFIHPGFTCAAFIRWQERIIHLAKAFMKTFTHLAVLGLGTILGASPVRAQSPDATKHLSQVKALLDDLLKQTNADPAEKTEKPSPAPQTQPAQTKSQDISPETLTQLQKLLNQLLKSAKAETDDGTQGSAPAPAPTTTANGQKPASMTNSTGLTTPALKSPALNSAHLMPSGPLDGRGLKGGTPRLSDADWRQLFLSKQK